MIWGNHWSALKNKIKYSQVQEIGSSGTNKNNGNELFFTGRFRIIWKLMISPDFKNKIWRKNNSILKKFSEKSKLITIRPIANSVIDHIEASTVDSDGREILIWTRSKYGLSMNLVYQLCPKSSCGCAQAQTLNIARTIKTGALCEYCVLLLQTPCLYVRLV